MTIRNKPNFFSGLLFILFGLGFAGIGSGYAMGTLTRMGPGYFPVVLGVLLAIVGIVVTVASLSKDEIEEIDPIRIKPLVLILGSMVIFGLTLKALGFVLASVLLLVISAIASHEFSWRYFVPMAVILIISCYLAFIYGLGLPMPMWPLMLEGM